MNIRQACKCVSLERSSFYYQSKRKEDTELIDCLNTLSEKHPSYGFKKMFYSLRNQGFRTDNGPEFTSSVFSNWCHKHRIGIRYIQPGKPVQNAFIERFNRSYRTEVLDARIFTNLIEVREITAEWMTHYNNERPHESLGNLSPMQYLLNEENSPKPDSDTEFSPFQQIPTTPTE